MTKTYTLEQLSAAVNMPVPALQELRSKVARKVGNALGMSIHAENIEGPFPGQDAPPLQGFYIRVTPKGNLAWAHHLGNNRWTRFATRLERAEEKKRYMRKPSRRNLLWFGLDSAA